MGVPHRDGAVVWTAAQLLDAQGRRRRRAGKVLGGSMLNRCLAIGSIVLLAACTAPSSMGLSADPAAEVRATEESFARSMAERNFAAFSSFVADDAIFFDDGRAIRGKAEILAQWRPYFDGAVAPFSWHPAQVEVPATGDIGYSQGPVYSRSGEKIATYRSIWRHEKSGGWKIVLAMGS
jgi:ketosteroid isomerase-like protein